MILASTRPTVEILESRIAPAALYFVQSNSLAVHKGDGTSAQDTSAESDAATAGHANVAVLLAKGDTLIFDADNDHTDSAGDTMLAKITGGQAMLFFTNGIGPTAGGLDQNEITGAAVADGFRGSFFTDINGSVVTALDAAGNVTVSGSVLTVQESSLASLHVTGQIHGNVLAGRDLSDLDVGGKLFNTGAQYSVSGVIATGTKTSSGGGASFNDGANTLTVSYVQPSGASGGNIADVTIPFGAAQIAASDGANIANGNAGAGGSVEGVEATSATGPLTITAGKGGNATASGTGGRGGSLEDITITEHTTAGSNIAFTAGSGGFSAAGSGGPGGSLTGLTVELLDAAQSFAVLAGIGGVGGDKGNGGAGGALADVTVLTLDLGGDLRILAGDGVASGAAGGRGGPGGTLKVVELTAKGAQITGDIIIGAGKGGNGFAGAGAGGSLSGVTADVEAAGKNFDVRAGNGGNGSESAAKSSGGAGGKVADVHVTTKSLTTNLDIQAGSAGNSVFTGGKSGGAAQDIEVTTNGAIGGSLLVNSGSGGLVLGTGNGGKGGPLSAVTFNNHGGVNYLGAGSGFGGPVMDKAASMILAKGNGGKSGSVKSIIINNYANITAGGDVGSGAGGQVAPTQAGNFGSGGGSGDVSGVIIHDLFAGGATGAFRIYAGSGKSGFGDGAKGGNVGVVKDITLDGSSSHFMFGFVTLFSSIGGDSGSGAKAAGGKGGLISNIHGTAGILEILAGAGGNSAAGRGGPGASVVKVNVTTTGAGHFLHLIAAGDGGSGSDHHAGAGGSVRGVITNGDIGDFTKTFGLTATPGVQGGIAAGKGGSAPSFGGVNGAVEDITADRIATIIAGRPAANSVSAKNGVSKLAKISATVLGANTGIAGNRQEVNAVGTFDWNDGNANATYDLGAGDTAIDGLILVNATTAPALPVTPLKLVLIS